MRSTIASKPALSQQIAASELTDVKGWLQAKAIEYQLRWLLAHADDGVMWGKLDGGHLITSYDAVQADPEAQRVCPPLRLETLQQARFFAEHAELLLWRDGDNAWHARLISDSTNAQTAEWKDAIDEAHMLWGTDTRPLQHGFTLMSDGAQGLRHAVPLEVKGQFAEQKRPPRLVVRHYVKEDLTGFTRIVASRLVALHMEEAR